MNGSQSEVCKSQIDIIYLSMIICRLTDKIYFVWVASTPTQGGKSGQLIRCSYWQVQISFMNWKWEYKLLLNK